VEGLIRALVLAGKLGKAWMNQEPGIDETARRGSLTRTRASKIISPKKVPLADKHHYIAESVLEKVLNQLKETRAEGQPNEQIAKVLESHAGMEALTALRKDLRAQYYFLCGEI